jgi:putative RNA 2'-phosphotransferase
MTGPGADVRRNKWLSLVLRHHPERAGIVLDEAGWADVDAVLAGARASGVPLSREELLRVVAESPKRRFALDGTGTRVRAVQGHSVPVALGLATARPPELLWHGTHAAALDAIRREGLRPMGRHHVHLSADPEAAARVGARRGRPVVLEVAAGRMHARGLPFWRAENGVWLCDAVPPDCLR